MRWLLHFLALASFLLAISIALLWLRSSHRIDLIGYEGPTSSTHWQRGGSVSSALGAIRCEWWLRQNEPRNASPGDGFGYTTGMLPSFSKRPPGDWYGFIYRFIEYDNGPPTYGQPHTPLPAYAHEIAIPDWFALLMLLITPTIWLRRTIRIRRTTRRVAKNLCIHCGYDLRESPERCPECGAPSAAPPSHPPAL